MAKSLFIFHDSPVPLKPQPLYSIHSSSRRSKRMPTQNTQCRLWEQTSRCSHIFIILLTLTSAKCFIPSQVWGNRGVLNKCMSISSHSNPFPCRALRPILKFCLRYIPAML